MRFGRYAAILAAGWLVMVAADEPPSLESSVLAEINHVRAHPHAYADELRRYRDFFDGRLVRVPGDPIGVMTNEGTNAVDDAIAFLDRQAPLPPLANAVLLAEAAGDLARDQARRGYIGHRSADGATPGQRAKRRGGDIFVSETISYGYDQPDAVIRQLIIDDGVAGRGHRGLIFAPGNGFAGVACGFHPRTRYMCVIDYSATATGAPKIPAFVASGR